MKNIIFLLTWLMVLAAGMSQTEAQTILKDPNGNYYAQKSGPADNAIKTGKTFTDQNGKVFEVLQTKTGKEFVVLVSKKTGKPYRRYLTK